MSRELIIKFENLCKKIASYKSALVAFSGGCDSALVAYLTNELTKCLCIIGESKTMPSGEIDFAVNFCRNYNIEYRIVSHNILENSEFCKNEKNRCFYCKNELYKVMSKIKENEGWKAIFDGSNFDDINDFRPGREALENYNIITPLLDARLSKNEIRRISRALRLATWNKPQLACLSSRFPYGVKIDEKKLEIVDNAEKILKKLEYRNLRARYHGEICRIEIGREEKIDLGRLRNVVFEIKKLGFKYVTLDLEGYRSGSLNE